MSTTESKQSASTFSYAQAAKSSAAVRAGATLSGQETSGTTTPMKDVSFTSEAQMEFTTVGGSSEAASTNGGEVKITGTDRETYKFDATIPASIPSSIPTSSRHGSTSPKEETITASQLSTDWREGRPKHNENNERRDRDNDRKRRKGKKKEVAEEAEPEEPKPVTPLVPAPLPATNIWAQRMGAQTVKKPVAIEAIIIAPAASESSEAKPEKKKTKSHGAADAERPMDLKNQAPKKDGSKAKDDSKRSAPRGQRQNEKDEKAAAAQIPPPVEDAISWPTPVVAIETTKEKEKAVKEEKAAEASSADKQPRPKQAWVTVPYTPTVTFNTPLPGSSRGGRGGDRVRGGRERGPGREGSGGRAGQSAGAGEKTILSASTNATPDARERGRNSFSSGRASSLPVEASKRNPDFTSRDSRKPLEKPTPVNQSETAPSSEAGPSTQGTDSQAPNTAPIADTPRFQPSEHANGDAHGHPHGQQPELNARSAEFMYKEGSHHGHQSHRGRGGYRGRGNGNFSNNGQMYVNGQPQQPINGFAMRPNGYSPPQAQQFAGGFPQRGRGGHGQGRAGSMAGTPIFARYPGNVVGAPGMAPLQTNMMYGYTPDMQQMGAMSALPYNQYVEQYSVIPLVIAQIDYYFSIDNLCKDVYLRKHMDSQGFVPLTFITGFKRIQSLINNNYELLRIACLESRVVELVQDQDHVDRIRRAEGWDKWLMPMEDRDETAKNEGPKQFWPQVNQYPGMIPMQQAMPQPQIYPNGFQGFQAYPGQQMPQMNGQENGYTPQQQDSPLSAAVPEFAPEQLQPQLQPQAFNIADYHDAETTFKDEEIPNLSIYYTEKAMNEPKSKPPFVNASQRTFSNGSIDARLISEELAELERRGGHSNGGSEVSDM